MRSHTFKTSEEAFKQPLFNSKICIGDLLLIPSEKVIGVCDIWSFSITVNHGWLDSLETPNSFNKKLINSPQLIDAYSIYSGASKVDGININQEILKDNIS